MNDYYDYLDKQTANKPAAPAQPASSAKPAPLAQPTDAGAAMTVEESDASETIIARVKAFWRK